MLALNIAVRLDQFRDITSEKGMRRPRFCVTINIKESKCTIPTDTCNVLLRK